MSYQTPAFSVLRHSRLHCVSLCMVIFILFYTHQSKYITALPQVLDMKSAGNVRRICIFLINSLLQLIVTVNMALLLITNWEVTPGYTPNNTHKYDLDQIMLSPGNYDFRCVSIRQTVVSAGEACFLQTAVQKTACKAKLKSIAHSHVVKRWEAVCSTVWVDTMIPVSSFMHNWAVFYPQGNRNKCHCSWRSEIGRGGSLEAAEGLNPLELQYISTVYII